MSKSKMEKIPTPRGPLYTSTKYGFIVQVLPLFFEPGIKNQKTGETSAGRVLCESGDLQFYGAKKLLVTNAITKKHSVFVKNDWTIKVLEKNGLETELPASSVFKN